MNTTTVTENPLPQIKSLVAHDLERVDQLIIEELISKIPLIQQITQHIVKSGGKRLRPLLVILSANALGYRGDEHLELAAIIEFVHTATLLHDDVVDESNLRRGQQSANAIWGNQASVLVGDFLYSRAFQLLARRANTPVMRVLAKTTNAIAEGEVLQLMNRNNPDISEANYLQVIYNKTARLFESATEIGAIIATSNETAWRAMAQYGVNLGLAFQITDDLLDYTASTEVLGKNIGDDLAEGKATLPLIYALNHAPKTQADLIRQSIEKGGLDHLAEIMQALEQTNAFEYVLIKAKHYRDLALQALDHLPNSACRDAMAELVEFVIERNY